ncbi:MAG: LytR/AlgR family response regulator transcription factor [Mangrovibacterium sp.]
MNLERKYNCLVVDDEFLARKLMAEYISKVQQLNLIGSLDNPVDAIDRISKREVDILFIDIEMSDISGIDFIKSLTVQERPAVIFVTAYPQYAVLGFEVDATEYLVKPVTFPRFIKAVNKAVDLLNLRHHATLLEMNTRPGTVAGSPASHDYMIVRSERKIVKLRYSDIYFIEGAMEYVSFQLKDKKVMSLFSLKQLEEELPPDRFLRIHKSYIVALNKIREIEGNQVKVGNWTIYVSKALRPALIRRFSGAAPV